MKKLIRNNKDLLEFQAQLFEVAQELTKGKQFDVEIKEHREKRSINSNNYSWALQDKIAKQLNTSIDAIHEQMVLRYGVLETISVKEIAWESVKREFEYCKEIGRSKLNGTTYVHARIGVGTHHYNTKEMSQFINGVVNEAKDLGIETLDEIQLKQMVDRWGKDE